jgi:hypothetical protein
MTARRKGTPLIPEEGDNPIDYLDREVVLERQFKSAMGRKDPSGSMRSEITPEKFIAAIQLIERAAERTGNNLKISFVPMSTSPETKSGPSRRKLRNPKA